MKDKKTVNDLLNEWGIINEFKEKKLGNINKATLIQSSNKEMPTDVLKEKGPITNINDIMFDKKATEASTPGRNEHGIAFLIDGTLKDGSDLNKSLSPLNMYLIIYVNLKGGGFSIGWGVDVF